MMRYIAIILFSPLFLLVSQEVSADPSAHRPDRFFQQGYVKGAMKNKSSGKTPRPSHSSMKPIHKTPPPQEITQEELAQEDTEQDSLTLIDSSNEKEESLEQEKEEKTIPIQSLALIINASEVDESFSLLANMSNILKQFDIQPEAVYTMQIPQFFVRDASYDWANIIIRGGRIAMNRKIVEQYNIKKVPTWIARTAVGDVVLEGYQDISSFLNLKGELRRAQLENLREDLEVNPDKQSIIPAGLPNVMDQETATAIKTMATFDKKDVLKKLLEVQNTSSSNQILPELQRKEAAYEK